MKTKIAAEERVRFHGQPNITATHSKTLEVTMEERVTKRGNCIVGASADKACADLSEPVKKLLKRSNTRVRILIQVGPWRFEAFAHGDPRLTLKSGVDMVLRKSTFVCPRTLAVGSDRAASDLPRQMVLLLHNPEREGVLTLQLLE